MGTSYRDQPLGDFVAAVAARRPAPGGGAVAAVAVAMAAGLVGMAARFSPRYPRAPDAAERGDTLRGQALALADEDARAYHEVLAAYRLPEDPPEPRRHRIRAALRRAAEPPERIAGAGAEVAALAADLAEHGNPNLRGDAVTAALLADSAVRSAARLARLDLELAGTDPPGEELLDAVAGHLAAAAAVTARLEADGSR